MLTVSCKHTRKSWLDIRKRSLLEEIIGQRRGNSETDRCQWKQLVHVNHVDGISKGYNCLNTADRWTGQETRNCALKRGP